MEGPLLVGLGGGAGAACRYLVGLALADARYPLPTLVVNVLGSFLFGGLIFGGAADPVLLLVGVGFCGALTTYSTFSVETVRLWEDSRLLAVGYALGTLAVCLVAAALGGGLVASVT